ncbi:MAG TPA: 1-(5-phosphoribosyl)-5-[(5-phosphoribosylamino)methylideneamino]imidazole-4-carboxamide isomerase [Phycisphaerae bacterium]|nr:1-(5-phosphoribosyl)-5-[(5-phosphoribosylamino)methylideneamino]imidazole-4-carboxamide isomerase [Phycisphaerae bacterium]
MDIYPAIDIRDGKCVRLIQGDYGRQLDYADDPVAVAVGFAEIGAKWLHVIDLDAAKEGRPKNLGVIRKIVEATRLPVQVGGGLRTDEAVSEVLGCGAQRAIIGTAALENWSWFVELVGRREYEGRIALSLDARGGMLAVKGWTETTSRRAVDVARLLAGESLSAIVYTDIERDGMLGGPNVAATTELAAATSVPVIAAGGVGSLEHVRELMGTQVAGVVIGRALYEQTVDLGAALALVSG